MNINTEFLTRYIDTLEVALEQLPQYDEECSQQCRSPIGQCRSPGE